MERLTKWTGTRAVYAKGIHTTSADRIEALNKLAAFENAEEQGRLVMLPCKVGDTVYRIVTERIPDEYRMQWHNETFVKAISFNLGAFSQISKTVFLTRKAAEAALKELNHDK